jgi:hypothetical protein
MATELTEQQRKDRKRAIQKVRDFYPQLKGSDDDFIMSMVPGMVKVAEQSIYAERERDEAMRLLEEAKLGFTTPIYPPFDGKDLRNRIDAFLAAHPANGGQDEPQI